jgi:hypothetical protein
MLAELRVGSAWLKGQLHRLRIPCDLRLRLGGWAQRRAASADAMTGIGPPVMLSAGASQAPTGWG